MYILDRICPVLDKAPTVEVVSMENIPLDKIVTTPKYLSVIDPNVRKTKTLFMFYKLYGRQGDPLYFPVVQSADDYKVMISLAWNNGHVAGMVDVKEPRVLLSKVKYDKSGVLTLTEHGQKYEYPHLDFDVLEYIFGMHDNLPSKYLLVNNIVVPAKKVGEGVIPINSKIKGVIKEKIENYLAIPQEAKLEQVMLLVGHAGIGKSSVIYEAAQSLQSKWGVQLIKIRTSFINQSDIYGFSIPDMSEIQEEVITNAPMKALYFASDQFLKVVRDMIIKYEKKLPKNLKSEEKKFLKALRDYARTPVVFFDEVNRTKKEVRQAMIIIWNTKAFLNLTFREAKFITAANAAVGMVTVDTAAIEADFYNTVDADDVAFTGSFITTIVNPKEPEVYEGWLAWAEGKLIPEIVNFVKESPRVRCYNWDALEKLINEGMAVSEVAERPMVTYRGWENVSKYLKKRLENSADKDEVFVDRTYFTGVLGENDVVEDFIRYINYKKCIADKSKKWKVGLSSKHVFDKALEQGWEAGVPVMLSGLISSGKTARVEQLANKKGAKLLVAAELNYADRAALRGTPRPRSVMDALIEDVAASTNLTWSEFSTLRDSKIFADIKSSWEAVSKEYDLPPFTTIYAPHKAVYDAAKLLKETDSDVVLFFDEINRAKPIVQSIVYEIISTGNYMGLQFDLDRLKIVMACDVWKLTTSEKVEKENDIYGYGAALTNMVITASKTTVDESDREAFLDWGTSKDNPYPLHPAIVQTIKELTIDEYAQLLMTVADRNLTTNAATTRSINTLSKFMTYAKDVSTVFTGSFIFKTGKVSVESIIDAFKNKTTGKLFPASWIGRKSKYKVTFTEKGSETQMTGIDIINWYAGLVEVKSKEIPNMSDEELKPYALKALKLGLLYEEALMEVREGVYRNTIGEAPITQSFITKLNANLISAVQWNELVNVDVIPEWLETRIFVDAEIMGDMTKATDEIVKFIVKAVNDFKYNAKDLNKLYIYCLTNDYVKDKFTMQKEILIKTLEKLEDYYEKTVVGNEKDAKELINELLEKLRGES